MSKKQRILIPLTILFSVVFLLIGWVIPVRLKVILHDDKKELYFDEVTHFDITVCPSPLFRVGTPTNDYVMKKLFVNNRDYLFVNSGYLFNCIDISSKVIKGLKASYQGQVKEGDAFDKNRVEAAIVFGDDHKEVIDDYSILPLPDNISYTILPTIKTAYGDIPLELDFLGVAGIQTTYNKVPYEGDLFDNESVSVELHYEDGTSRAIGDFVCDGPKALNGVSTYEIFTRYGTASLTVTPVKIKYAIGLDTCYAGKKVNGDIRICYEDGTEKIVNASDISTDKQILTEGVNSLEFHMNGTIQKLYVKAKPANNVIDVAFDSFAESQNAVYYYFDERIYCSVNKINDGRDYYLTHIAVCDPTQIRVEPANGILGNGLELPSFAAARTNWLIGINGSFFNPTTAIPLSDCIIRNGQILSGATTSGYEICITENGGIYSPPAGISASELLKTGVRDVLISTDPLLIQDGEKFTEGSMDISGRFPRTAIGMVRPGEYFLVSSDIGLYYPEMQNIFDNLGCIYARSLDGGDSISLMYKNQAIIGCGRAVADFLSFIP